MKSTTRFIQTIAVLPSSDIARDIKWHEQFTGFTLNFTDTMYASIQRDHIEWHLQWHADNEDDPLLGGSVIKVFVKNIEYLANEFIERGTVIPEKFHQKTSWGTREFGFFDLNKNAVFFVEDL